MVMGFATLLTFSAIAIILSFGTPVAGNVPPELYEITLGNSIGFVRTSSSYNEDWSGIKAFDGSGSWVSHSPYTLPQIWWIEFPQSMKIVNYSFTSRPHKGYTVTQGPSKYVFWASNASDCTDETQWVKLHEDLSGIPFDQDNTPKSAFIENDHFYKCYGFKVIDVPGWDSNGKPVAMSNIHFYSDQELPQTGFLQLVPGSNRFFKLFTDKDRTWYESVTKCREEGGFMVKTTNEDVFQIRDALINIFGRFGSYAWLDAKYNGAQYVWSDGERISNENQLWWEGRPYPNMPELKPDYCMLLLTHLDFKRTNSKTPYWATPCSHTYFGRKAFCELLV